MSLNLRSALDRPLIEGRTAAERYLLLSLETPAGSARRLPLNLALVVDASGSMGGEKIGRARDAASFVVRQLSAVDRVALVAYGDDVRIVAPSTPLSTTARTDLLYRISRIEAEGMTNLSGGWLAGCEEVAKQGTSDDQLARVVLLSDGLANLGITGLDELVEHARQLRLRGVVTSTLGIGADFNEELLEALARHGGGRFQYVATAKAIPDCVQGELGEMLQIGARKAAVEVALPRGVTCRECLNDYVLDRGEGVVRVHLGDLIAGEARHVVLRLEVEPEATEEPISLAALALYVDGDSGRGTETAFPAVELRPADPATVASQPVDEEVAGQVAVLIAARAKDEAARLGRQGDDAGAAVVLAGARQLLSASPVAASPAVAQELSALDQLATTARAGLTRARVKELHYSSYLAREGRRDYGGPLRPV